MSLMASFVPPVAYGTTAIGVCVRSTKSLAARCGRLPEHFALRAAATWPIAASAQQPPRILRVGLLMIIPEGDPQSRADRDALELALHALGWIPGRNVDLNYRWSDGDETLLRKYGAELVATSPDVLMTEGTAAFAAVKRKTKSIPTIFVNVSDPVGQGFVASLAHPGGNTTGFTLFEFSMGTKWVEILRELVPAVKHIGFLFNPVGHAYVNLFLQAVRAAAETFKIDVNPIPVEEDAEIERSLAALAQQPDSGLIALHDPFTIKRRDLVIAQVARHQIPAVYTLRPFALSGGLISYGIDLSDPWRQAATYVDRVLKGANPGELPVQQPTKFELVINMKTAKAIGLKVPPTLLARADEVIE
jgi:putative tryptophan/tyrosine transport system substrate-binding protein